MRELPVGTYGVTRTSGWIGFLIRLGTRSTYNHAFVYIGDGKIVEAQPRGARITSLSNYDRSEVAYNDEETERLDPWRQQEIAAHAKSLDGTPYGFLDIVSLALLSLGIRWPWLARKAQDEQTLICSQLVARAYFLGAGIDLADGRPDASVTPGDLATRITERAWEKR